MIKSHYILIKLLVFSAIVASATLSAKTYRWVDENGKVHYSQSIPPSASQGGHSEINAEQGLVIREVESQKERQKKQTTKEEKAENKVKEAALRDELLIHMFASEDDLTTHFQDRIQMIGTNIRLLQSNKKRMKTDINELQTQLMRTKNESTKESLISHIRDTKRNLLEHTKAIETNQQEQTETRLNMERSLIKFRKKKAEGSVAELGSLIGSSKNIFKTTAQECNCPCATTTEAK